MVLVVWLPFRSWLGGVWRSRVHPVGMMSVVRFFSAASSDAGSGWRRPRRMVNAFEPED